MMKINEIYKGDCLELMPKFVESKSVDMIFCDLPYGTTQNKWDSEMDEREWIEDKNDYEPFKPFIKRMYNQEIEKLQLFKF